MRILLIPTIVVLGLLAVVFCPAAQSVLPTQPWVQQLAEGPLGWAIFFVLLAGVVGAYLGFLSPRR